MGSVSPHSSLLDPEQWVLCPTSIKSASKTQTKGSELFSCDCYKTTAVWATSSGTEAEPQSLSSQLFVGNFKLDDNQGTKLCKFGSVMDVFNRPTSSWKRGLNLITVLVQITEWNASVSDVKFLMLLLLESKDKLILIQLMRMQTEVIRAQETEWNLTELEALAIK